MTERSDGGAPLYEGEGLGTIVLGPATRKQLEAILSQTAGGLLTAVIEAAARPVDGDWSLTIERATLTCTPTPPAPNGALSPSPPSPSLSEAP